MMFEVVMVGRVRPRGAGGAIADSARYWLHGRGESAREFELFLAWCGLGGLGWAGWGGRLGGGLRWLVMMFEAGMGGRVGAKVRQECGRHDIGCTGEVNMHGKSKK